MLVFLLGTYEQICTLIGLHFLQWLLMLRNMIIVLYTCIVSTSLTDSLHIEFWAHLHWKVCGDSDHVQSKRELAPRVPAPKANSPSTITFIHANGTVFDNIYNSMDVEQKPTQHSIFSLVTNSRSKCQEQVWLHMYWNWGAEHIQARQSK